MNPVHRPDKEHCAVAAMDGAIASTTTASTHAQRVDAMGMVDWGR